MSNRRRAKGLLGIRPIVTIVDEAVATLAPAHEARETTTEAARTAPAEGGSRMTVQYIRAGWSLNGRYYSADLLRTEGVAAAVSGTQLFVDHAPPRLDEDYPVGSITRLAAVQDGPAWWDEGAQAVTANVKVFHPWRRTLTDMATTIGLSVRAWVTAESGEAEGRRGEIIRSIEAYRSVDFVTQPAAGGAIVTVFESVDATEARNAGAWFESFMHSDFTSRADRMYGEGYLTRAERITLSGAIGDALAAFTTRIETDAPQLFARDPYREPDPVSGQAAESGSRIEFQTYQPADPADSVRFGRTAIEEGLTHMDPTTEGGTTAPTATSEAVAAAARAQATEAELSRLTTIASQASEADRRAADAAARADVAEARVRRLLGNEAARAEVGAQIDAVTGVPSALLALIRPRVEAAACERVPFVAEGDQTGQVDAAGLTATVAAAITAERTYAARILEAHGAGAVTGFGGTADEGGLSDEDFEKQIAESMSRLGMPDNAAAVAAKGR